MASMIKPSHRGLLHEKMGIPKDKKITAGELMAEKSKAKRTHNTALMREVTFAQNFGGHNK